MLSKGHFVYIITGNGYKAMPVHSDLGLDEFNDYIRSQLWKPHKDSHELIFTWGTQDFVNPNVYCVDDYVNGAYAGVALIGIK